MKMTMDNGQLRFKKEDLLERVLNFGVRIIRLVNKLPKTPAGFKVGSQLVGSATSIGANTEEAQDASSKPDFINKMSIALREAKESKFWLKLIMRSELLQSKNINIELKESDELCAIYSTIVKKAKLNLSNVKSQMSNGLGFTLIELLVVISIISVLSAVGFTTYQGVQSKARDSTRKTDLQRLATALELYAQQHNLTYMDGTAGVDGDCSSADTTTFYSDSNPNGGIRPLMSDGVVPLDPSNRTKYCYISLNNGQGFRLFAKLDNCSDAQIIPGIDCATAHYNYSIVSDNTTIAAAPDDTVTTPSTSTSSTAGTPVVIAPQPATPITPIPIKRVFITSTSYGANFGGLNGADSACLTKANAANLCGSNTACAAGTWMAWLSNSTVDVNSRFTTKNNGPYKLINNTTIASNWADLTDGVISSGINVDEKGDRQSNKNVWTATGYNGSRTSDNCNNWQSSSYYNKSSYGDSNSTNSDWTQKLTTDCFSSLYFYCFEQ